LIYLRNGRTVTPVSTEPAALVGGDDSPPAFLRLVGHPIRWRLLKELSHSDHAVRELTVLLGEKQSLISYHLAELRDGELVRSHRSSADARDSYYSIDLVGCRELLQASGTALHPGLRLVPGAAAERSRRARRPKVLFLCTGNGTRSQIAEALLESLSGGSVDVESAGSNPKPVHPNAVRVLAERGIDIRDRSSKHLDRFVRRRFDHVITLCDRVREVCPDFPGAPDAVHWSIPDPGLEGDSDAATYPAFVRTADELETRIGFLLPAIHLSAIHRPTGRSPA
jgi:ArsR family transcriptional regulator, arsenate/arsenite/antimonite-responsive transcriptional repressor / arsenate reductase (thioredoxin)